MVALLVRTGIVSVWLGLLFLLWQGDGDPQRSQASLLLPEVHAIDRIDDVDRRESWMGLYMNGHKVGYSSFHLARNGRGYLLTDRSVLRLRVMGRDQTIYAQTSAEIDASYALQRFRVRLQSGVGLFQIGGRVADGQLSVEIDVGSQTDRRTFRLDGPIFLPSAIRIQMAESGMRAGARTVASVFDPASMSAEPIIVETIGLEPLDGADGEVRAWKTVESYRGMQTTVWLDRHGNALREEGPIGLVAVRESADRAVTEGWAEDSLVDLMEAVAIPVDPPIQSPRELRTLQVHLEGLGGLALPSDQRQSSSGGSLRIQREDAAARASYRLPWSDATWAEDLAATAFVQSDHPKLRRTAARVLAGEVDARKAAVRLRRWVYDNLDKRPVASIPNALQVLEMGAGDCNEHAVLYAGLARASGLPARVVAGVVYAQGVFLYHSWNEVWLGGGWVSVDAAFDQMPVDATHVKLLVGEPDQHIGLVPVIGKLSIDVIAAGGRAG